MKGAEQQKIPALDELFAAVKHYRFSKEFSDMINFVSKLPRYSPFNGLLLYVQNPGVSYTATSYQWQRLGRTIKDGARPYVILAPFSPVLFVFDVTDTEGDPLPEHLINPFKTKGNLALNVWAKTLDNLYRDAILLKEYPMHANCAGGIQKADASRVVQLGEQSKAAKYQLDINSQLDRGAKYATLIHELGHLYCGHLGTPNEKWWPNRSKLNNKEEEFEAECVTWLICERAGIQNPSASYLSGYLEANSIIPEISLDIMLKVAGLIESMGKQNLKPRKKTELKTVKSNSAKP